MALNSNLHRARENKLDEFYTQMDDITFELKHYKDYFKGKVVFCNCDDPFESNFFKYFAINFNYLGLKKLISTCYDGSPVVGTQLSLFDVYDDNEKKAYKVEITSISDMNNDGIIDLNDVEELLKVPGFVEKLEGNGDFRSAECVALLEEADIVVTNPPFSLFREYLSQLIQFDKKFIIISSQNSLTTKEVFNLIKDNLIWLGYRSGDMSFKVPEYYPEMTTRYWVDETGQKWRSLGNICWLTNLDINKRHESLVLYKKYNPVDYPKYDNYNAINVNKVVDIPVDYFDIMGVPITFLDKYNPEQFEIIGHTHSGDCSIEVEKIRLSSKNRHRGLINGKQIYDRILIRRK